MRACELSIPLRPVAKKGRETKLLGTVLEGEKTLKDGNASRTLLGFPELVILFIDFGKTSLFGDIY